MTNDHTNNYYEKHREERLAYAKQYREENKDKIISSRERNKEYSKRYRKENKDKIKEYNDEYYKRNKLNLLEQFKTNYKKRTENKENGDIYEIDINEGTTRLYHGMKTRSRNKGKSLDVDKELVRKLIECSLVEYGNCISLMVNSPTRISMDKIDPSMQYTEDNIQVIPQWLNFAYHNFNKDEVNREIIKFAEYLKAKAQ